MKWGLFAPAVALAIALATVRAGPAGHALPESGNISDMFRVLPPYFGSSCD